MNNPSWPSNEQSPPERFGLPSGEIANTATHAFGLLLSLIGAVVLVITAQSSGDAWRVVGCVLFSGAMIAVYLMSTLSHAVREPNRRRFFRVLDQAFIYLLIVGTYTPFSLTYLRSPTWWVFLVIMWSIAIWGFVSKIIFAYRVDHAIVWTYVLLGWMPILPTPWLIAIVPVQALWLMLGGGLCYTVGTIFLVLDIKRLHFHALWHLFVIAGSALNYFAILQFVAGHNNAG